MRNMIYFKFKIFKRVWWKIRLSAQSTSQFSPVPQFSQRKPQPPISWGSFQRCSMNTQLCVCVCVCMSVCPSLPRDLKNLWGFFEGVQFLVGLIFVSLFGGGGYALFLWDKRKWIWVVSKSGHQWFSKSSGPYRVVLQLKCLFLLCQNVPSESRHLLSRWNLSLKDMECSSGVNLGEGWEP